MRKPITLSFITFLFMASLLEVTVISAQPLEKIPVIVGFRDKSDTSLVRKNGGEVKFEYSTISAVACSLPQGAIEALERNPRIAYIELDEKVQMTQEGPHFSEMFPSPFDGVDRIDADLIHKNLVKGEGIDVAILDTGIDHTHLDLDDNYMSGYDFVNIDDDPMDDNGHGTIVAGIVAAEGNGDGLVGVAPEASLYIGKVLDATGSGEVSSVIAGIDWAIKLNDGKGVDIISMSLGSTQDNQPMHDICNAAYYTHGILVVAAAGNNYQIRGRRKELDTVSYPARYDSVIAVGATDNTDTRASYSSTGSTLELVAPGENINSTFLDSTYILSGGTSIACPHVTGTAALLISSDSELSASDVRERLQDTADDLGNLGWDSWYGYGLVDANAKLGAPSITKLEPDVGMFISTATQIINATVQDADGIDENSIDMTLDGTKVGHFYDISTDLVSISTKALAEGLHTAALNVSDIYGNYDVTSWSFTVDMTAPGQVTGITVEPLSSNSLFISWKAITDSDLAVYLVYRKAPGGEYSPHAWVCTHSEGGRAGFLPDIGLEPDTTYSYQITAWDIAGNEGIPSDPASETTAPMPIEGDMHVDRIEMYWGYAMGTNQKNKVVSAEASVRIVDDRGAPVPGATVYGHWEGATTDSDSVITDVIGWARIRSDKVRNPESSTIFTFVVEDVDIEGWTYEWTANGDFNGDGEIGDTSNSVTYP